MKKYMFTILIILVASISNYGFPQKATIAVGEFINKAEKSEDDKNRYAYGRRAPTENTEAFVDMIINALVKTRKFEVVERSRIEEALQEQGLGEMGMVESGSAKKFGELTGADFILIGTITQYSVDEKKIGTGNFAAAKKNARMAVDIRVMDAASGSVKIAESVEVEQQGSAAIASTKFAMADDNKGILGDVMRKCSNEIVQMIVCTIYPVKIVSATEQAVVLNYGNEFIQPGQVFDVFDLGEALIDPDTGDILGQEETKVGIVRVTDVQAKFSKAEIISGGNLIQNGMVCRLTAPPDEKKEKSGFAGKVRSVKVPW